MNTNEINKSNEDKPDKKAYRSPQLAIYGNIGEVTRAVSPTGNKNDNQPKTGKDKT